MNSSLRSYDDLISFRPPVDLSNEDFIVFAMRRSTHTQRVINHWNLLYRYFGVEYCALRRRLFQRIHRRDISTYSSIELCQIERYSGCINVTGSDGIVRHVCDIVPIVLGTDLDIAIRKTYWSSVESRVEDLPKIGLIVQNKNFYHFTSCMITNPRVAHIYRRNTKRNNMEVRMYFYDKSFRGNKLYFVQQVLVERCEVCRSGMDRDRCTGIVLYVQEQLLVRNCYKQDFVLLTRQCDRHSDSELIRSCLEKVTRPLQTITPQQFYTCCNFFPLKSTAASRYFTVQVSRALCECKVSASDDSWTRNVESYGEHQITLINSLINDCFVDEPCTMNGLHEKILSLFVYLRDVLHRNEDIDMLCNKCIFDGPILYCQFLHQFVCSLIDKCSDPNDLYDPGVESFIQRMRELSHTANLYMLISRKTNIRVDQTNDMKRLIKTSLKREKMQTFNLCSGVKAFPNVTCNANIVGNCVTGTTYTSSNSVHQRSNKYVGRDAVEQHLSYVPPCSSTIADEHEDNTSAADFVLRSDRRKRAASRNVTFDESYLSRLFVTTDDVTTTTTSTSFSFYTGLFDGKFFIYSPVSSYNARQLMNFTNMHLMQGLASSHYTDPEFVMSEIKRPRIANQQNSSKCALIPRNFVPFLALWRIGSIESAGRSMNYTERSSSTFFVSRVADVCHDYYIWLKSLRIACKADDVCTDHGLSDCTKCYITLTINEVPRSFRFHRRYQAGLFFLSKKVWPSVQFYCKSDIIVSVTVQSGILVVPVILNRLSGGAVQTRSRTLLRNHRWLWCRNCRHYFPQIYDFFSSCVLDVFDHDVDQLLLLHDFTVSPPPKLSYDGAIRHCPFHVWLSPNEIDYVNERLRPSRPLAKNPFFYELACHGALITSRFFSHVDISKAIVSINAVRRSLRFVGNEVHSLETLVDQNSRIVVKGNLFPWMAASSCATKRYGHMVLRDKRLRDSGKIVAVSHNNMFYANFVFGDYLGFNCEDAYVFDIGSRPVVDNVVQLKVNYYKSDRSVVKSRIVRFFFHPEVSLKPACGCSIFLGELLSYKQLSFGATMLLIRTLRHQNMYRYLFFYDTTASYLRKGEPVFDGDTTFPRESIKISVTNFDEILIADESRLSNVSVLYEASVTTSNGNITVFVQLTTRQIRFNVTVRNVRTTQKLQNMCGQKGMPVYADLSDLQTADGQPVHIIVSLYSVLGRRPMSQLLEQVSNGGCNNEYIRDVSLLNVYSRSTGRHVAYGGKGAFFFSCDSAHDNCKTSNPNNASNPMRVCKLMYNAAIDNGLSTSIFSRNADHENFKNNPSNGMPYNLYKLFSVYRYLNRKIDFSDFDVRRQRQRLRDWVLLRSLGLKTVELPHELSSSLDLDETVSVTSVSSSSASFVSSNES